MTSTYLIYLLFIAPFGIIFFLFFDKFKKEKEKRIYFEKNGVNGKALVIKTENATGLLSHPSNKSKVSRCIKFTVTITKIDGSKTNITSNLWLDVNEFYLTEPGKEFNIIYDPKNIANFIIGSK